MKFTNTSVYNIHNAILGARNPKESWLRSDSVFNGFNGKIENTIIGEKDLELMQTLIRAGSEHRKFMRQIFVSVDITASQYWWSEFDTYKVGTVANSTSKMHKLASTPITMDCFEMGDYSDVRINEDEDNCIGWTNQMWHDLIYHLELLREKYNETKDKRYWKELIRLLPESWLQTRTVTMNYENLFSMIHQRENHKLTEWSVCFMDWVKTLPYAEELLFVKNNKKQ